MVGGGGPAAKRARRSARRAAAGTASGSEKGAGEGTVAGESQATAQRAAGTKKDTNTPPSSAPAKSNNGHAKEGVEDREPPTTTLTAQKTSPRHVATTTTDTATSTSATATANEAPPQKAVGGGAFIVSIPIPNPSRSADTAFTLPPADANDGAGDPQSAQTTTSSSTQTPSSQALASESVAVPPPPAPLTTPATATAASTAPARTSAAAVTTAGAAASSAANGSFNFESAGGSKEEQLKAQLAHLKKIRGRRALTAEESINILRVYLSFQLSSLQQKQSGASEKPKPPAPFQRTINTLGYSRDTISTVIGHWRKTGRPYSSPGRGKFARKTRRLKRTAKLTRDIRAFVAERVATHSKVTATQLCEHLVQLGHMSAPKTKREMAAALRLVQRRLLELGYAMDTSAALQESVYMRDVRRVYARRLRTFERQRRRFIWVDEACLPIQPPAKPRGKGAQPRTGSGNDSSSSSSSNSGPGIGAGRKQQEQPAVLCCMAAIQGHNPQAPQSRKAQDTAGVVPGSVEAFLADSKSTDDPTAHFTRDRFIGWFQRLVDSLNAPSVIIMSDGAHHRTRPPQTPDPAGLALDELRDVLEMYGQRVDPDDTHEQLQVQLQDYIEDSTPHEVEAIAAAKNHIVLFFPPQHHSLNPMEKCWAHVKQALHADPAAASFLATTPATSSVAVMFAEQRVRTMFEAFSTPAPTPAKATASASDSQQGEEAASSQQENMVQRWIAEADEALRAMDAPPGAVVGDAGGDTRHVFEDEDKDDDVDVDDDDDDDDGGGGGGDEDGTGDNLAGGDAATPASATSA